TGGARYLRTRPRVALSASPCRPPSRAESRYPEPRHEVGWGPAPRSFDPRWLVDQVLRLLARPHGLRLLLTRQAVEPQLRLGLVAGLGVAGADVDDAVGVDREGDRDRDLAARPVAQPREFELAEVRVVGEARPFALRDADAHHALVGLHGREH